MYEITLMDERLMNWRLGSRTFTAAAINRFIEHECAEVQ
jgi:hypothetical protein